jgi:hypothetical protein
MLVVERDYLPDSEVCFSHAWTPFPNGGCGGAFPPQLSLGGSKGGQIQFLAPPGEGFRGNAPEVKFWEKLPCKIL